ncbi:MAG: hypothetical protein QUV05_24335 [Phycisphaerae bacterium]|nr:hypothetical protein [Phycisphaerae bacterium]
MARRFPGEDGRLQDHVPQELVGDMRRLHPPGGPVPANVDEAVLAAARARITTRRRAWIVLRRVSIAATAAAAAVGLAVWIGQGGLQSTPTAEMTVAALTPADPVTPAGPKDIDRNGHVNILDAFMLARHLDERLSSKADGSGADAPVGPQTTKRGQKPFLEDDGRGEYPERRPRIASEPFIAGGRSPDWDFNGDGVVDQGDVDAVAMAAVRLKGGAS